MGGQVLDLRGIPLSKFTYYPVGEPSSGGGVGAVGTYVSVYCIV